MAAIVKTGGTGIMKLAPKEDLQAIADEISLTAEIFGLGGDEIKHLKKAFFYANIGNGLVPDVFKGDYRSIFIMSQLAVAMQCDLIRVLQGGYFVHGRWGWYAEFMINRVLELKIYASIEYESGGADNENLWVRAIGTRLDGTKIVGTTVSMKMAREEAWTKNSKYSSMPAYMLKKRAATFLIRETAAHVFASSTMTSEELEDLKASQATPVNVPSEFASTPKEIGKVVRDESDNMQRMEVLDRVEKAIAEKYKSGDAIIAFEESIGMSMADVAGLPIEGLLAVMKLIRT